MSNTSRKKAKKQADDAVFVIKRHYHEDYYKAACSASEIVGVYSVKRIAELNCIELNFTRVFEEDEHDSCSVLDKLIKDPTEDTTDQEYFDAVKSQSDKKVSAICKEIVDYLGNLEGKFSGMAGGNVYTVTELEVNRSVEY